MPVIDRNGHRYGRLTVVALCSHRKFKRAVWRCVCDCGNVTEVESISLASGSTLSCGCFGRESSAVRFTRHGMSKSPEYAIWSLIIDRCTNSHNSHFGLYGGRGILICPEWRGSFLAFYSDMGPRPSSDLTVDRIDPNGNYCKENCRWADKFEQANNRRNNQFVQVCGERMTIAQAARKYNVLYATAWARIRRGLSGDQAFNVTAGGRDV